MVNVKGRRLTQLMSVILEEIINRKIYGLIRPEVIQTNARILMEELDIDKETAAALLHKHKSIRAAINHHS